MKISLEKWEDLERRYHELVGTSKSPESTDGKRESKDLNLTLALGPASIVVKPSEIMPDSWEVIYRDTIPIIYIGPGSKERAEAFAEDLRKQSKSMDDNVRACQEFLESCEDWPRYSTQRNREILTGALMKVRPLTANKIWAVWRRLIDSGDIKPRPDFINPNV